MSSGERHGRFGDAVKRFVNAEIEIAPDDRNGVSESHTFTITLSKDIDDGNGFVAAAGEHVSFAPSPSGGAAAIVDPAASSCDNVGPNTDAGGQCKIVFTSNTASTIVGAASATVSITTPQGTQSIAVSTDGTGLNSGSATKVFVAGTITWTKVDNSVPPCAPGGRLHACRRTSGRTTASRLVT